MTQAIYKGTAQELRQFLRQLPAILSGKVPDTNGIAQELRLRIGVALLSKVQQDFVRKSRGQTGEDGIKWPPLKPSTIERRRLGKADRQALTQRSRQAALTPAQRQQVNSEFRKRKALMIFQGIPEKQAEGLARAQAYNIVRAQGGQIPTRREILGNRQVDILRDTGELFRSFSPGIENRPSYADGQVFEQTPDSVIIGTNKKPWHHLTDGQGKLPQRAFWPKDGNLPSQWWDAMLLAGQRGLARVLAMTLGR